MQRKSFFLPISVPKKRLLTWVVSSIVFFFLPQSLLATTGDLDIMEDNTLTEDHLGNIIIGKNGITLDCAGFSVTGLMV